MARHIFTLVAETTVQRFNPKVGLGLSLAALVMLYSVMMIGVYISSSFQGLSCPDWPLCPNGFDLPSPRHFYEYTHRLLVLITAGLIYATAAYSATKMKPARKAAILAAILMSAQIVLGMLVVTTRLHPIIVATHLSTGMALFAMTLMTFLAAYRLARKR